MNKYEIMFIVKADIAEEEVANVVKSFESIITDMGGKILNSKDLGQKKLAYEIEKQVRGYYHYLMLNVKVRLLKSLIEKL